MRYIVISGIDGSGKTTIINSLTEKLHAEGFKTQYFWMRYHHYFVKPMHAFARIIGLSKKYSSKEGFVWRHEFYKSAFFCKIYIIATYFDTWLGKRIMLHKIYKNSNFIICDRWINDIIIDLGTKTHNNNFLPSTWAKKFKSILPPNSLEFVIVRDNISILDCRIENQEDPDFSIRSQFYIDLTQQNGVYPIDNTKSIEYAVNQILLKL